MRDRKRSSTRSKASQASKISTPRTSAESSPSSPTSNASTPTFEPDSTHSIHERREQMNLTAALSEKCRHLMLLPTQHVPLAVLVDSAVGNLLNEAHFCIQEDIDIVVAQHRLRRIELDALNGLTNRRRGPRRKDEAS